MKSNSINIILELINEIHEYRKALSIIEVLDKLDDVTDKEKINLAVNEARIALYTQGKSIADEEIENSIEDLSEHKRAELDELFNDYIDVLHNINLFIINHKLDPFAVWIAAREAYEEDLSYAEE